MLENIASFIIVFVVGKDICI